MVEMLTVKKYKIKRSRTQDGTDLNEEQATMWYVMVVNETDLSIYTYNSIMCLRLTLHDIILFGMCFYVLLRIPHNII